MRLSKEEEKRRKKFLYKRVVREICSEENLSKDSTGLSDGQKRYIAKEIAKSKQKIISSEGEKVDVVSDFVVDYRIELSELYEFISTMGTDIFEEFNEKGHFYGFYCRDTSTRLTLHKAKNVSAYVFCYLYGKGFDIENKQLVYQILRYACFWCFEESEDYHKRFLEAKKSIRISLGKIPDAIQDMIRMDIFGCILYQYISI